MNALSKTIFLFIVATGFAAAQPFSAGVKVGVPLTDALSIQSANPAAYAESTDRYVVGPYAEIRLPFSLSVEVDALYRSYNYRSALSSTSVGSWEFPVLAKYRLLKGPIRPFIDGGPVFDHISGIKNAIELNHSTNFGIALGAGVEIHALVLRLTPEIRYDGFALKSIDSPGDVLHSNRNQLMVMLGIGF